MLKFAIHLYKDNTTSKVSVSDIIPVPSYTKPYRKALRDGTLDRLVVYDSEEIARREYEKEVYAASIQSLPREKLKKLFDRNIAKIKKYLSRGKLGRMPDVIPQWSKTKYLEEGGYIYPRKVARAYFIAKIIEYHVEAMREEIASTLPGFGFAERKHEDQKENSD